MKNPLHWLTESNRPKHILCGTIAYAVSLVLFLVILSLPLASLSALYVTAAVAATAEIKDKLWGGTFDWLDLLATILPALAAHLLLRTFYILLSCAR